MPAHSFAAVAKDMTASSVHVPTALGNSARGKAKPFKAILGEVPIAEEINKGGPETQTVRTYCKIAKVDDGLGLVFGWAMICKVNGADYYDLNIDLAGPHAGQRVPEHIPEDTMVKAAAEFMESARAGNEMHDGPDVGKYVFAFPLTTDIAKAMNIQTETTGLLVAYKPPAAVLAKFKSGEYSGFSIEGRRLSKEEHDL